MDINIRNTWGEAKEDISNAIKSVQKNLDVISPFVTSPEIIVTSRGGADDVVVCVGSDGTTVEGVVNSGKTIFKVPGFDVYTVTGTHRITGYEQTQTVEITACQQYNVSLEYYSDVFADNSWETIIDLCERNVFPDVWKVGDKKGLTVVGGYTDTIMILAKGHDIYAKDGTVAPVTFVTTLVNNRDVWGNPTYRMHNAESNAVGWRDCERRTELNKEKNIANNAQNATLIKFFNSVKPVKKKTFIGSPDYEVVETEDKFWFLSGTEFFGDSDENHADGEGKLYEFYANGNDSLSNDDFCWTRSPYIKDDKSYCIYKVTGYVGTCLYGTASTALDSYYGNANIGFCF